MHRHWWKAGLAWMVGLLLIAPPALGGPPRGLPANAPGGLPVRQDGHAYCFTQSVSFGSVIIAGGRCYTTYVVRTSAGYFLGFGPPGPPMIPPGQLVRMNTPAGAKHKGRLFYLVPLGTRVPDFPLDAMRFVTVQFLLQGGVLVISVPVADGRTAVLRSGDLLPQEHR